KKKRSNSMRPIKTFIVMEYISLEKPKSSPAADQPDAKTVILALKSFCKRPWLNMKAAGAKRVSLARLWNKTPRHPLNISLFGI
ncbi:MAG: hypothetical protein ACO3LE_10325, partial [Bdellovibrionota bacterium]